MSQPWSHSLSVVQNSASFETSTHKLIKKERKKKNKNRKTEKKGMRPTTWYGLKEKNKNIMQNKVRFFSLHAYCRDSKRYWVFTLIWSLNVSKLLFHAHICWYSYKWRFPLFNCKSVPKPPTGSPSLTFVLNHCYIQYLYGIYMHCVSLNDTELLIIFSISLHYTKRLSRDKGVNLSGGQRKRSSAWPDVS